MPKKTPPIAEKISPMVGAVNIAEKSQPFPHKINAPIKTMTIDTSVIHVGFSLTKINMQIGTAIQERVSKNVFLAGVVDSNPMNWNRYAAPNIIPAGKAIQYFLLKSLNPPVNKMKKNIAITPSKPLTATSKAGE